MKTIREPSEAARLERARIALGDALIAVQQVDLYVVDMNVRRECADHVCSAVNPLLTILLNLVGPRDEPIPQRDE